MYTCCPICKTNFSVTEAQLQVAQGKVRCGSCKNVFNARQHIHYHETIKSKIAETKPSVEPSPSLSSASPQTRPSTEAIKQTKADIAKRKKELFLKKAALEKKKIEQASIKEKPAVNEIDAIFNALDSQLSSGTYIDITKIEKEDIREAEFNDIFDDDELNEDEQPKLNLSTNKVQQHTFDFLSLPDEPDVTDEVKEQLAAVNTPLNLSPTNKLVTKTENDSLHKAIDNIINVDNTITTPFEENDDDHFVIEMNSEPDVELVDEHDIDKLFASTDNLKMSDLKFGTSKAFDTDSQSNNISNSERSQPRFSEKIETDENISGGLATDKLAIEIDELQDDLQDTSLSYDLDSELNFDNSFNEENSRHEKESEPQDEPNTTPPPDDEYFEVRDNPNELDIDFDDAHIDEEIVLSSVEEEHIPHRLRDAVAHLEQQPTVSVQKRLSYIVGVAVFLALAGFQLVIFKSSAIANTLPALQPMLVSACASLPCRYTGNHNRNKIKILSRDVRLHPKIKAALLISATIINQANYTQPYPTILLKFTDLTGATVAQRYFQPSEYLGLLNKPFAMMPSKKPIQLNLEILDPGSDAINFQFFFL